MSLTAIAWIGLAAYSIHMLEEFGLNWRDWARNALHLPVELPDFYVTNFVVIVLGIAQAQLAAEVPLAALSFSALMLINGIFLHIIQTVRMGRYSPGLFTALLLFVPIGIAGFWKALSTGLVSPSAALIAFVVAIVVHAIPIAILLVKNKPFFDQTAVRAA